MSERKEHPANHRDEWTLFRQFGLACYEVVDSTRQNAGRDDPSGVLEILAKNEYDKVVTDYRYQAFFADSVSQRSRQMELRHLLSIGVKLLSLTLDPEDSSRLDLEPLMGRINATTRQEFYSRVGLSSQLGAVVLALAYPVESVMSLTDDEIVSALTLIHNVEHFLTEPWSLFQHFGTVCDSVMIIQLAFLRPQRSDWDDFMEAKYDSVLRNARYRMFFRSSVTKEERQVELHRLVSIGAHLLLLNRRDDESHQRATRTTPVDELLSKRNKFRRIEAFVLMMAYPVEQVLLLTDDEIVQAVRIVESSERLIPWDTLFRFVDGEVDDALVSVMLGVFDE